METHWTLAVNGKAKIIDKEDARNIIRKVDNSVSEPINKRLVITKTVNNDTRRVKPRDEGNYTIFSSLLIALLEREKKSKKERRKEIEIKRKRRHGSSSSEGSEEEYVERKAPIITKVYYSIIYISSLRAISYHKKI